MINCIIVHGCPSDDSEEVNHDYAKHWMPWVKNELEKIGIPTEIPLMPKPWLPDYHVYKAEFEKCHVDENSILVGHSCGCAFLVHWLGETKRNINKLILVAPWKVDDVGDKFRETFYGFLIDETIQNRVREIVMFTSDNEKADGKKSLQIYYQALGGKIIELNQKGHFTLGDMGTEEFTELVEAIKG